MKNNDKSHKEIKELYKNYFNIGQVGLLDKFDFQRKKLLKQKAVICTLVQVKKF